MTGQNTSDLPTNHVLAVIEDAERANQAASDLREQGFGENALFKGEELVQTIDAKGEYSGLLSSIVKAIQDHLSEEPNYLAQYQEEARAGKHVIAVYVDGLEEADRVRDILLTHDAHNLRFFGPLAVHDLTPQTNPSARSADSPEPQSED